ncbi:MAG: HAMP domain-containing sensor histidine kinase [Zetaproteobacteria bacterium]|nr:HAMP domain-containing sensor histidine kinase [Zetaproteobacteria bacterium]
MSTLCLNGTSSYSPEGGLRVIRTLQDFSIGSKVFLGFLPILGIASAVGVIGILATQQSNQNLQEFKQAGTRSIEVLDLEREIIDLQRNVQMYSSTGYHSLEQTADLKIQQIMQLLGQTTQNTTHQDNLKLLHKMRHHIEMYQTTFDAVKKERKLRTELVQTKITALKKNILAFLHTNQHRQVQTLSQTFMAVDAGLYAYLVDPYLPTLIERTQQLRHNIQQVKHLLPTQMKQQLEAYLKMVTRITQATRSYLYLISVVMGGVSQEFSYTALQLKQSILNQVKPLTIQLENSSQQMQIFVWMFVIISILIGIVMSWTISRNIALPIRKLAEVFQRLGEGEFEAAIPFQARRDEIGTMAQAANVFKDKNQQTVDLLANQEQLTQHLEIHRRDLKRSNDEMNQFVYTVSHDLKSPIVTSMGFIGMIKNLAAQGKVDQALDKIPRLEKANRRMSQLIHDLLDLSRVGRVDLDQKNLDTHKVIREVLSTFEGTIHQHDITIILPDEVPSVYANESRLMQIYENLLGNALKYAVNQEIKPIIEFGSKVCADEICLYVKDNGPGIEPKYHKKVFGLFQRLNANVEGTGIGLSVVHKAMLFHQGRVWIESHGNGDGCIFWLAFPKQQVTTKGQQV